MEYIIQYADTKRTYYRKVENRARAEKIAANLWQRGYDNITIYAEQYKIKKIF